MMDLGDGWAWFVLSREHTGPCRLRTVSVVDPVLTFFAEDFAGFVFARFYVTEGGIIFFRKFGALAEFCNPRSSKMVVLTGWQIVDLNWSETCSCVFPDQFGRIEIN